MKCLYGSHNTSKIVSCIQTRFEKFAQGQVISSGFRWEKSKVWLKWNSNPLRFGTFLISEFYSLRFSPFVPEIFIPKIFLNLEIFHPKFVIPVILVFQFISGIRDFRNFGILFNEMRYTHKKPSLLKLKVESERFKNLVWTLKSHQSFYSAVNAVNWPLSFW